jgi:catechol 2,3-dioxygenase-like lactoylglutathione lyase family enzyme
MDGEQLTEANQRRFEAPRENLHRQPYKGASPIQCRKLGHFVYEVSDVERTAKFWTEVMGFVETDRNEHGMVFFRCGADHHGIGLKPSKHGKRPDKAAGLQAEHLAFEVDSLDVLLKAREYFRENNIPIIFEGRKGAGCNTSINFLDPDGYEFEIYYGIDQVGPAGKLRPASAFRRAQSLDEAIANPVPKEW